MSKTDPGFRKEVRVNFTVFDDTIISRSGTLKMMVKKMVKIEENYGMGHTSKGNLDKKK